MAKRYRWVKYWRFWVKWRGVVESSAGTAPTAPVRLTALPDPTDAEIRAEFDRRKSGRPEPLKVCLMCTNPLMGKRSHQKFCSGKCRSAYFKIKAALKKERQNE